MKRVFMLTLGLFLIYAGSYAVDNTNLYSQYTAPDSTLQAAETDIHDVGNQILTAIKGFEEYMRAVKETGVPISSELLVQLDMSGRLVSECMDNPDCILGTPQECEQETEKKSLLKTTWEAYLESVRQYPNPMYFKPMP